MHAIVVFVDGSKEVVPLKWLYGYNENKRKKKYNCYYSVNKEDVPLPRQWIRQTTSVEKVSGRISMVTLHSVYATATEAENHLLNKRIATLPKRFQPEIELILNKKPKIGNSEISIKEINAEHGAHDEITQESPSDNGLEIKLEAQDSTMSFEDEVIVKDECVFDQEGNINDPQHPLDHPDYQENVAENHVNHAENHENDAEKEISYLKSQISELTTFNVNLQRIYNNENCAPLRIQLEKAKQKISELEDFNINLQRLLQKNVKNIPEFSESHPDYGKVPSKLLVVQINKEVGKGSVKDKEFITSLATHIWGDDLLKKSVSDKDSPGKEELEREKLDFIQEKVMERALMEGGVNSIRQAMRRALPSEINRHLSEKINLCKLVKIENA